MAESVSDGLKKRGPISKFAKVTFFCNSISAMHTSDLFDEI